MARSTRTSAQVPHGDNAGASAPACRRCTQTGAARFRAVGEFSFASTDDGAVPDYGWRCQAVDPQGKELPVVVRTVRSSGNETAPTSAASIRSQDGRSSAWSGP